MNLRFIILASLLLVLVAVSNASAATSVPTPSTQALTQGNSEGTTPELGVDPYYGFNDLRSKAAPVAFCLCTIGVNCCGDPGIHHKCSLQGSGCTCNSNNDCVH